MSEYIFKLRFSPSEIQHWASRYFISPDEHFLVDTLAPAARARGYLGKSEFLQLCRWKTPRSQPRCASNSAEKVREATAIALATDDERAKVYILRTLAGIEWPTASVILHFCDKRPYPIVDYRALWSLGYVKPPTYCFDFWLTYTSFSRDLARSTGYDMRILDRALWQHSKEQHQ